MPAPLPRFGRRRLAARRAAALVLLCLGTGCRPPPPRSAPPCPPPLQPVLPPQAEAAPASQPSPPGARAVLIRGATVWTVAGPVLPDADVLLQDGRIAAVGRGLTAPAGALLIPAAGKHLTPGLIDPHSHLGVYPVPGLVGNADGNEVARPVSPSARAADAFWPQDPGIPLALAAGVTTAHVVPGSANLMGGEGMVVHLLPGREARDLLLAGAPQTMKMACGENPKRVYGEKGGPYSRMGNVARVRALLERGRQYQRRWQRYAAQLQQWRRKVQEVCGAPGQPGGGAGREAREGKGVEGEALLPPEAPARDLELENVVGVLEGRLQVHMHCYRADEMLLMLRVAREFGFSIKAFHHATEAYKIRDALRAAGTGAVTWVGWWGFKVEALDHIPEAAALLLDAGAPVAMHSDSPQVIQRLNQMAALSYYKGRQMGLKLQPSDALRLVTLEPARILGIADRVGSVQVGKLADLTLWDGDPLSVYTRAERVFVAGRLVYDRTSDQGRRPTDFELGYVPRPGPLAPGGGPPPQLPAGWSVPAQRVAPPPPEPGPPEVLAIQGGQVHPLDGTPPFVGTVLVRGPQVVAVGPRVAVPAGARVIDATGLQVTPGLVAAESTLGLVEIDLERTARDHFPTPGRPLPVRADLRTWDALNLASAAIPVTRMEGFTSAVVRPFGGLVSGQAAAFDLAGQTPAQAALAAPVAIYANLGLNGAGAGAGGGSRALALMRLRRLLTDARLLLRKQTEAEQRRLRRLSASYAQLSALVPVLQRRVPLVVYVDRAADILAALQLAAEQQVRLVLSGAAEGWQVAEAIARARVPVLVEADLNLPASFDALGGRFDNAARLHRAGVVVGLSADGRAHDARSLRHLAGLAVAWGLPHEAALAALTTVPAQIFGLADRGTLRPGARANLVLWSGDPLELSTEVRQVLVGGRDQPLRSRQTELRQRYRDLDRYPDR